MSTRISNWLELNFWQFVVRLLSVARPLSHGVQRGGRALSTAAPIGWLPRGWPLALVAWLLGFAAGILLAW